METVRKIVTLGLEARQKAGIKVRQPLASLKLKIEGERLSSEYLNLINDELNVKEVVFDNSIKNEIELDTKITPELKTECDCRELVRALQEMRKKMGLTPNNVVGLIFETNEAGRKLIQKFETDIKKTVLASKIEFRGNDGAPTFAQGFSEAREIKIDDFVFKVKIER